MGCVGLVVNLVVLLMLREGLREHERARRLPRSVRRQSSVPGVVVAAVVLIAFDWEPIDAIIGVAIGLFMVRAPCGSRDALCACSPRWHPSTSTSTRPLDLGAIPGVVDVHDVHVWTLTSAMDVATRARDGAQRDRPPLSARPGPHAAARPVRDRPRHLPGGAGGPSRLRGHRAVRLLTDDELAQLSRLPVGEAAERAATHRRLRRGARAHRRVPRRRDRSRGRRRRDAQFATAYDEWTPWPTTGDGDGDGAADRYRRARPRARRRVRTDQPRVPHASASKCSRRRSARRRADAPGVDAAHVERPPEVRIRTWAGMLHGNFAAITVTEDDEKFVITQNPCGSVRPPARVRRAPWSARPRDGHRGAPDHLRPRRRADLPHPRCGDALPHGRGATGRAVAGGGVPARKRRRAVPHLLVQGSPQSRSPP